ncbi:hypothetical protein L208DRAFT_1468727 [Tricholoma matsutake]|nr:hypothetical protein L208DRAFT_1468727 [Tricholoma matsutake 945]
MAIENAKQEARHHLSHLPEHVASLFQGAMTTNSLHQEQLRLELQQRYASVTAQLEAMGSLLQAGLLSSRSHKRQKASAGSPHVLKQNQHQALLVTVSSSSVSTLSPAHLPLLPSIELNFSTLAPSLSPNVPTDTAVIIPAANTVSPNGIIYSVSTFPLSNDPFMQSKQLEVIATLKSKFSPDRLCSHQFEWI